MEAAIGSAVGLAVGGLLIAFLTQLNLYKAEKAVSKLERRIATLERLAHSHPDSGLPRIEP